MRRFINCLVLFSFIAIQSALCSESLHESSFRDFATSFNGAVFDFDQKFYITSLPDKDSYINEDVRTIVLNDDVLNHISLQVTFDDIGNIKKVIVVALGDKTSDSTKSSLFYCLATLMAFDPSLNSSGAYDIINSLGLFDSLLNDISDDNSARFVDYSISYHEYGPSFISVTIERL